MITTQKQVRELFWQMNPKWEKEHFTTRKRQNDYNATIRSSWVDFVDSLQRNGEISEALAYRVTL